jgi:putative FmdB family regulatory protein
VPTYQYACTDAACGHRFETVQSVSDEALTVCPECEGRLRKVFSAVGVVFKGSGFYRTDSRASSNGKAAASTTPASESTSASSSGSSKSSSESAGSAGSTTPAGSPAGSGSTSSSKAAAS